MRHWARKAAEGELNSAGKGFFLQEGLMYRHWQPPRYKGGEGAVEQLALLGPCQHAVLRLAHEIPWARKKQPTAFYNGSTGPACTEISLNSSGPVHTAEKISPPPRREKPAPLIPLPIIEEPFSRIALDVYI